MSSDALLVCAVALSALSVVLMSAWILSYARQTRRRNDVPQSHSLKPPDFTSPSNRATENNAKKACLMSCKAGDRTNDDQRAGLSSAAASDKTLEEKPKEKEVVHSKTAGDTEKTTIQEKSKSRTPNEQADPKPAPEKETKKKKNNLAHTAQSQSSRPTTRLRLGHRGKYPLMVVRTVHERPTLLGVLLCSIGLPTYIALHDYLPTWRRTLGSSWMNRHRARGNQERQNKQTVPQGKGGTTKGKERTALTKKDLEQDPAMSTTVDKTNKEQINNGSASAKQPPPIQQTKRRKGRFRGLRALVRKTWNALNCCSSTCTDCLPRRQKEDQDQPHGGLALTRVCWTANTLRLWRTTSTRKKLTNAVVFSQGVCLLLNSQKRQLLRVKVQSRISLLNMKVTKLLVETLVLKKPKRAKSLFV